MPNWVCVDASFVVRLLESDSPESSPIKAWMEWHEAGRRVVSPGLLYHEVTNALHRYVVMGELSREEAVEALDAALGLEIELHQDPDLHRRSLTLAAEIMLAATYDAHYLALAERLGAELWTADARLARTAAGRTQVHLVEEADR